MDLAKLLLKYIKTLIWPVVFIFVFFIYEDEILSLLENREIDAFGLKIGKRIEDISKNYEAEINELRVNIENSDDNKALLTKIDSINKNIKKELSQIQEQTADPALTHSRVATNASNAADLEREGFEAILDQNSELALEKFRAAKKLWPDFHNVSEIASLLKDSQEMLGENDGWREINQTILEQYSWGMPDDIREKFKL